jgi:hypothetical protein
MMEKYILKGREIVRVYDLLEWAKWYDEAPERQIADTTDGNVRVSTIFLGFDHNWGSYGPPLFFETMVFGGEYNLAQSRWSTYDEAEAGHKKMCELAGVTDILEAEIIV